MNQEIIDVKATPVDAVQRLEGVQAPFPVITDLMIAQAERNVANVIKAKQIALRVTTERDWEDFDGEPYLNAGGAMKVVRLFGVEFSGTDLESYRHTLDGLEVIQYTARTTGSMYGCSLEDFGITDTTNKFFGSKNGKALPLSEMSLPKLQMMAVTRAQSRVVQKLVGLGGVTWEEVRGAIGNKAERVAKVDFTASKAKREDRGGQAGGSPKTQLLNMLQDLAGWDQQDPKELLKLYTTFRTKEGEERYCSNPDKLSDGWAAKTLEKVRKVWQAHPGAGAAEAPGADQPPMPDESEVPF